MKMLLATAVGMALGVAVAVPVHAQGPVREGLRGAGEIAVEGTRRVAEGTGQVLRGAGQAAAGVAEGTVDAGRAVIGGAARGVRAGVDALTPGIPWQARADVNLQSVDRGREARWRFQRHGGEWWYYTPRNAWMYHRDGQWNEFAADSFTPNPNFAGEYATGYRGVDASGQVVDDQYGQAGAYAQGPAQPLYVDRYGREYICDNGRRVYVNSQQTFDEQGQPYGAAYRGEEGQLTPTPQIPTEAGAEGQGAVQGQVDAQGQPSAQATGTATTPATPTPPQSGTSGASELPAEAPREINQQSTEPTSGAIEGGLPPQ